MKMKHSVLTLLLTVSMLLTFMPAMAFAEESLEDKGGDRDANVESDIEETQHPLYEKECVSLKAYGSDWSLPTDPQEEWLLPENKVILYGWVVSDNVESLNLEYQWLKGTTPLTGWNDLTDIDDDGDLYAIFKVDEPGTYTFSVREKDDVSHKACMTIVVYPCLVQNSLVYNPFFTNRYNYVEVSSTDGDGLQGDIVIPNNVVLADGKKYIVKELNIWAPNARSISIPASVTFIYTGLGIKEGNWDDDGNLTSYTLIPGFVIYGKTGSAAHAYAKRYGIAFRDLEAEAAEADDAEWNGNLGSIPAAKSVKVKAGKKKVTVSWKKAAKKKLKKFDKVEIQVCPDKGFARANTKRVEVKKSKKSKTVKGLAKKKTYYVRVRQVKGSGKGKIVSKWSKARKIKTR